MKLLVSWGNTSPASAEVVRGDVTPLRGAAEARNEQGADTRSPVCSAVSTEPRTCWPRSTLPGACNTRNPTPLGQPRRLHGLPAHPTPRTHTEKWRSHARPTTRFCFFSNPTKLEMGGGLASKRTVHVQFRGCSCQVTGALHGISLERGRLTAQSLLRLITHTYGHISSKFHLLAPSTTISSNLVSLLGWLPGTAFLLRGHPRG